MLLKFKMKHINILLSLVLIYPAIANSQQTFPKEQKCEQVEMPCTYNLDKNCLKEVCGNLLKEQKIKEFITKNKIIGKKFSNAFDLEDYFKKNIPNQFSNYEVKIVKKGSFNNSDYDARRIVVEIDDSFKVTSLVLN